VRNVFAGGVIDVDTGEVNGRIFVNNSGIGFYPHFVRQREELERHGHVKRVAFLLALSAVVRRYFRLRIRAHMDEAEALEQVTPFLFVGNNRYQTSGLEIGTRSRLDSGLLWVCTAPRTGRSDWLGVALRTLFGGATDRELNVSEVKEIWVHPETPRVSVSTDGEVSIMDAPLHYRIRPRALRVVVPAPITATENEPAAKVF
jgi:diacylglycerol kinase family enzyme